MKWHRDFDLSFDPSSIQIVYLIFCSFPQIASKSGIYLIPLGLTNIGRVKFRIFYDVNKISEALLGLLYTPIPISTAQTE
jgi:hypothetical protein